ncbi:MAG: hypothetical protein ACI9XO_002549 [Paraglaciecola sp.]|jgi:hypothetical protein
MNFFTKLFCLTAIFISTNIAQAQEFDGYALYNRTNQNTVYLIDKNEDIAHTWSMNTSCNYAVLLMPTGNIMRGTVNNGNQINGAAVGGTVQEIDPDGNVVWEFTYSSADHVAHHDITLMPNGNVLLTAWEVMTNAALTPLGYTGSSNEKYPTHFIEVSQNGTGGEIVWEWHMIDHMVQDVDSDKPSFGVVSEHPELMNINVQTGGGGGPGGGGGDWFHVNGVDYDEEKDQITFSSRFLSEVFIIDHSTTTVEAASHEGGNAGKGGDFLYRWGNPENYDMPGTQTIPGAVHDTRFIENDGRPRAGFLQFFNNEGTGNSSTVDALELPLAADGYNYDRTAGEAWGPTEATFRHICIDNANGQSASNSLPNGNVFVNLSMSYMYEADLDGNIVWQYSNNSAKAFRYTCDYAGVEALTNGDYIEDLCMVNSVNEILQQQVQISPNPSAGVFQIDGLTNDYTVESIQVFDFLGKRAQEWGRVSRIDLTDKEAGIYFVTIRLADGDWVTKKIIKQ